MRRFSPLEYNMFIIEANRLGRRMKILAKAPDQPYVDECFDGFDDLAETLWAIGTVLKFLGDTPNAYINPEAIEALRDVVQVATSIEKSDWAAEVLKSDSLFDS